MANEDFEFDLDSILAEFLSDTPAAPAAPVPEKKPAPAPVKEPETELPAGIRDFTGGTPNKEPLTRAEESYIPAPEKRPVSAREAADVFSEHFARGSVPSNISDDSGSGKVKLSASGKASPLTREQVDLIRERRAREERLKAEEAALRAAKRAEEEEKERASLSRTQRRAREEAERRTAVGRGPRAEEDDAPQGIKGSPIFRAGLMALCALCMLWSVFNIHPTTGKLSTKVKAEPAPSPVVTEAPAEETVYVDEPEVPEETPEPVSTPKPHYTVDRHQIAPAPNKAAFGSLDNSEAAKVLDIIQQARDSGLLAEDETTVFSTDVEFYNGGDAKPIEYYIDDTILMITWKEVIDGNAVTFSEIKIADGSQFRRKLTEDTYGSNVEGFLSNLSLEVNPVVAMNADCYRKREYGIFTYDGEVYRFKQSKADNWQLYNCIDTLFVNSNGDFVFWHQGRETDEESLNQFIKDNDIVFSIAFGPILIENDELQTHFYPGGSGSGYSNLGEIYSGYSRAGIGQLCEHHYVYMTVSHSPELEARWTVQKFGEEFFKKGLPNAYCLDGGQTGEIVIKGEAYNHVDNYAGTAERAVPDFIYFVTAMPEGGATS